MAEVESLKYQNKMLRAGDQFTRTEHFLTNHSKDMLGEFLAEQSSTD